MPVNFLELRSRIQQMGAQVEQQQQRQLALHELAGDTLRRYAEETDLLRQRVESALQANAKLRCAVPTREPLNLTTDAPSWQGAVSILAADGSQVNPSRHDAIPFGVINVGAILLPPAAAQLPQEFTRTELLYHDEILTAQGLLTEGQVALRRDLAERHMLAELSQHCSPPVVAITDGPLELYREPREGAAYRDAMRQHIESLSELERMNIAAAGYVDRPLGDLFVRLLELMLIPEEEYFKTGKKRPLMGIRDEEIFRLILQPGQRSTVFAIQSPQTELFKDGLALHFFYLNVGREKKPAIARIELPRWVVQDHNQLDLLHGALLDQCRQMGSSPYPYALQRAHEIALVSFDEKKSIANMLALEYLNHGVAVGGPSHKQAGKDLSTSRTRYA